MRKLRVGEIDRQGRRAKSVEAVLRQVAHPRSGRRSAASLPIGGGFAIAGLTLRPSTALTENVKFGFILLALALVAHSDAAPPEEAKLLTNPKWLPTALDPAVQFRKTKLFLMTEQAPNLAKAKVSKNGVQTANPKSTGVVQEASITFERQYRLFGAVTKLDQRQRFGNYFDFYWRTRRPADLTARLEYRQEKLHSHIQAQEIAYGVVHGSRKTEFKVVGDDYFDNGRVLAWRCLLLERGMIVAETRSFLWR